jgi:thioredoxin reductase (NADPH)
MQTDNLNGILLNDNDLKYHYDVIILGAGAAGLTAGIYLSRAKLKTLIVNEGVSGGQMVLTHEIANYPGVESTSGYELARVMKLQAQKFGCIIKSNVKITNMELAHDIKSVTISNKETFTSSAVIIATGGKPRMLSVPGEEEFKGKGYYSCWRR